MRFLIEEKSSEFLLGICGRVLGLLNDIPPADRARLGSRVEVLARHIAEDRQGVVAHKTAAVTASIKENAGPQLASCEVRGHVGNRLFDFLQQISIRHYNKPGEPTGSRRARRFVQFSYLAIPVGRLASGDLHRLFDSAGEPGRAIEQHRRVSGFTR